MSFLPVVPMGGYAGWRFLERTIETQKAAHDEAAAMKRDTAYFRENIGKVTSAEALVADHRLLSVALGAFGLDDDIGNMFFIQKILSDGTQSDDALANKIADKSYRKFSEAFGFGDFAVPNTQLSDFPDRIIAAYQTRQFEIAVGDQNADMRLALHMTRELGTLASADSGDDTKWYSVMGSEPLREVFETAFGLPDSFAALDIDKQMEVFRTRTERAFGDGEISQFSDPEKMDELLRLFLVRSELAASAAGFSPAQTALTLLSNAAR
ncbi:flagellar protein [Rhodovulum sp. NI22]|nr:flagellar protein [Rhodovulum sp. NI22]